MLLTFRFQMDVIDGELKDKKRKGGHYSSALHPARLVCSTECLLGDGARGGTAAYDDGLGDHPAERPDAHAPALQDDAVQRQFGLLHHGGVVAYVVAELEKETE